MLVHIDMEIIDILKVADLPISVITLLYLLKVMDRRLARNQTLLENIIERLLSR